MALIEGDLDLDLDGGRLRPGADPSRAVDGVGRRDRPARPAPARHDGQDGRLHPLFRAPDRSLSGIAAVLRTGVVCPAHDQGSWAVVGVYRGRERETRYRLTRDPPRLVLDRVLISPAAPSRSSRTARSTPLRPLDGRDAASIHVYGTDIVSQHRRTYDPASGAASTFESAFARPDQE
jgi:3-mercaptopropionate dioxygenase